MFKESIKDTERYKTDDVENVFKTNFGIHD